MPFYQYSVSDKQGQMFEGTLQAANTDAARMALSNAGYVIYQIQERVGGQPQPTPVAPPPSTVPPRPSPPSPARPTAATAGGVVNPGLQVPLRPRATESASAPQINALSGGQPPTDSVKTKKGRDKDLYFLFTQFASYFRSGLNPVQALNDLTHRTDSRYHDSMRYAAQRISEGGKLSDAFEKYPYLYPPDVIGVLRAGETSGFLPEAMDEIAQKMDASHHLKRRLFYFQLLFLVTVAVTPLILGVVQGSLASIKAQDAAGGQLPVGKTLGAGIGMSFLKNLPATILIFGGLWGMLAWFNSMKMRDFRHRLVMRTPVLSQRARAEAMARFTWALGMICRGGLAPQSAFLLALQAVPNLALRRHLEEQGKQMTESEKLSTALKRTNLLPFEYGAIVETGEVTGDIRRALESVYRASDAEFQAQSATTVARSSFFLYALLGVMILIISAWLLLKWYGGLFTTILGE